MAHYKEFQFAWWIFILVPIWVSTALSYYSPDSGMSLNSFLILSAIFMLIGLLFYSMKTIVDDSRVCVIFGIGLIRKSIYFSNIESVVRVRSKWYYGWGIRLIPSGWLFNVSGLDGVDIKRKNDVSVIRIGTKKPDLLRKAIFEGISRN